VEVVEERAPGHRYVIVGNSAAGRAAALAIQAIDPDGGITVISEERADLYARPVLTDFVGGVSRDQLFAIGESYPKEGIDLVRGDAATDVGVAHRQVVCASGRTVAYDSLLLATGSAAVRIPWPGSDAEGIGYLRSMADAERLLGWTDGARGALVVGGGLLGLELVRAFHMRNLRITQLVRERQVGAPALDADAGAIIAAALSDWGVDVLFEEEVESFESADGRVCAAITKKGTRVECDLVGISVGARPRLELAEAAGLETDRGILVDRRFQSSAPEIYAAGDVAQAYDRVWGEQRVNTSWRNAREQGEFAGICMAGGAGEYPGAVAANYQLAAGLPFCTIGISNPPDPESYEVSAEQDRANRTYRKLLRKAGEFVGGCLVGDLDAAAQMEQEIREATEGGSADTPPRATRAAQEEGAAGAEPARSARRIAMHKMTEENVKAAFAGESQAHIKYRNFSEKAEAEGRANVARLFLAASFAEQVHAGRHLAVLGGVGSSGDNLAAAIEGETFEVREMYTAYIAVADAQAEDEALESFNHAMKAEVQHQELYQRAQKAVDAGSDVTLGDIQVCAGCGYTAEGEAPERCPVCGAPREKFVKF
jgi:NAD(P)H-nitrite reductase large subunit/rubrerythrin